MRTKNSADHCHQRSPPARDEPAARRRSSHLTTPGTADLYSPSSRRSSRRIAHTMKQLCRPVRTGASR
eukprot:3965212-Prymnesium_polylepis.1